MRALLSVYDKRGVVEFARGLAELGWELISTGGTLKALREAGLAVQAVAEVTGAPEILDGRVKTLHPKIHGGILARRNLASHLNQLAEQGITPIDLVAVNLYPFEATVARAEVSLGEALENIDIGGPAMVRSAAKNFPDVLVVVAPADYALVLEALRRGGADEALRRRLAQKAFQHTASYDTLVAQYLRGDSELFPAHLTIAMEKTLDLRYGENPHQQAAFYREKRAGAPTAWQLPFVDLCEGKPLSFNNLLDAEAAYCVVDDFSSPTVAIIKHGNPCGLASAEPLAEAYRRALSGDPVAAFGGIVGVNRPLDADTARAIIETFFEVIVAPAYSEEALALLFQRRDLRVLQVEGTERRGPSRVPFPTGRGRALALDYKRVHGGFLLQTADEIELEEASLKVVTKRAPTKEERADLLFAWRAAKHVKSNAIVLARDLTLVGMGAGQPSRVASVEIALRVAGERAQGSALASDAFFPFADGVELAARDGVRAVIQPGGSLRDAEVIAAADRLGLAMLFTGQRHFKH